jgi:phytol kinase
MTALMLMCGGDGLADVLGRRFGQAKLLWNKGKSWAGSLGMLLGGWIFAFGVLAAYLAFGIFPSPLSSYILPLTVIALAGTLVESLPLKDVDNLTVTLAAVIIGYLFW